MSASTLIGLPLFAPEESANDKPPTDEHAELAQLEAVARANPARNFAWYQDEDAMAHYFSLRDAARKIYGKQREFNGDLPPYILAHIDRAGDAGSRAMSAAEFREDTDAELNDRINQWQLELRKPVKKHGGKKPKREPEDDFDDESSGDDENRRILQEWLEIAIEERARRNRIPKFDHLADMEQRALEKFGDDGFALMQLYVAEALAYEDARYDSDLQILVNGKDLACVSEAMRSLRQGDPSAAERFIDVLAKARADQNAGYPSGTVVTFEKAEPRKSWNTEACFELLAQIPNLIVNGEPIDLGQYRVFEEEFPIEYAVTPQKSAEWWREQFESALTADAAVLQAMIGARITEPIIVVFDNQTWHIIDGKKRLASRFYCGLQRIPAIWIVPEQLSSTEGIAQQGNLLDYDPGGDAFDDEDSE